MRGAPPPPVMRPPKTAADHQFVGAYAYQQVNFVLKVVYIAKVIFFM